MACVWEDVTLCVNPGRWFAAALPLTTGPHPHLHWWRQLSFETVAAVNAEKVPKSRT